MSLTQFSDQLALGPGSRLEPNFSGKDHPVVERVTKVCVLDRVARMRALASASSLYDPGFCFLVCLFVIVFCITFWLSRLAALVEEMTERFPPGSVAG